MGLVEWLVIMVNGLYRAAWREIMGSAKTLTVSRMRMSKMSFVV